MDEINNSTKNKNTIIILFRGTGFNRSYIQKKELISRLSYDLKKYANNAIIIDYPGPACDPIINNIDDIDDHDLPPKKCNRKLKYKLARILGIAGPSNMHFNVKSAYKEIINNININKNINQIILIGHSRGAIEAFMLSNKLQKSNITKNITNNIFAIDPVPGPITPKHSKYIQDNTKNLDLFLATECRLAFMTSIIPKISNTTNIQIIKLPTNHNGIVNLQCSKDKNDWRSIEATCAKHVSKYLEEFIKNKLANKYKIKLSKQYFDKNKSIPKFPVISEKEKEELNNDGEIFRTKHIKIRKKKLIIDYRDNKK